MLRNDGAAAADRPQRRTVPTRISKSRLGPSYVRATKNSSNDKTLIISHVKMDKTKKFKQLHYLLPNKYKERPLFCQKYIGRVLARFL